MYSLTKNESLWTRQDMCGCKFLYNTENSEIRKFREFRKNPGFLYMVLLKCLAVVGMIRSIFLNRRWVGDMVWHQ